MKHLPALAALLCAAGCQSPPAHPEEAGWTSLFDGKTLGKWQSVPFGGEGEVRIKDGSLILEMGMDATGVTWTGDFPTLDYEVALEAKRLEGVDFFCCIIFPVGETHCSFVVNGWAFGIVGLSCLEEMAAIDNETCEMMDFEDNVWYRIRVRVTGEKIEAWIDDKQMVNLETEGRKISVHPAVELCKPLGLSTWSTVGALRNIRMRKLD